ncbi:MAG TPA: tetratricopeptide repeat protein [Flavobacteriales bacterium]|nr:tetratricopeptide repeat protein [Flavobacteriales bacterium]HMW98080.1 tetratricopeptide repeat protein [Flavobacteriales bacterium]HNI03798.1 tetratricopeptide repeat protein [Flavobacteriales bacterium]
MSTRLDQLRAMLAEEPGDAFIRYAIALEYKRSGNMEEAVVQLERLLTDDPKYIACYYQLALLYTDLGRADDALRACDAGALQCLVTGDRKARTELMQLKDVIAGNE